MFYMVFTMMMKALPVIVWQATLLLASDVPVVPLTHFATLGHFLQRKGSHQSLEAKTTPREEVHAEEYHYHDP